MPRPNEPRAIYSEAGLARRIAYERQRLDMSLEGLAKRMTDAGCPIHASAIYKIEKGDPPRRITVDELVALSTVFGIPITELLLPPEAVLTSEIKTLFEEWISLTQEALRLSDAAVQASTAAEATFQKLRDSVEGAGPQEKAATRYFLELMETNGLRPMAEDRKALEKAEREAEKAVRRADAALKKSEARRG